MKSAAISKRIRKFQSKNKNGKEPIQVFCRVRPLANPNDPICLQIIPPCYVQMTPPTTAFNLRNGVLRDVRYTFKQVFDESISQKTIFDAVALPSVENVLCGKNALLFTYGVTGSGKTYTMTGSPQDGGIMPRCLDIIFNSISKLQAKKHIFKPDKLNSFEIQSEADAKADRDQDLVTKISLTNKNRFKLEKKDSDTDLVARIRDSGHVSTLDEDNCYAVFITYVEIYNNTVYDLLEDLYDEGSRPRPLQPKIVREDSSHNMFVHGVNEVEVSSTDEAFEVYYRGQKRKRVEQTTLNSESSRSHSVFSIRIVQAPLDESGAKVANDKSCMLISQLSLVDLAGSERTNRTKNTGERLREAGNINNSLLTLRTCIELLRENQNGANKIIPYRHSRLTHLFKNFFDGEGQVAMVICVSPHVDDFDEIMHVMKFAEISQDVQITVPTPLRTTHFTPGRRKAYQCSRQVLKEIQVNENEGAGDTKDYKGSNGESPISSLWFSDIPTASFITPDDDYTLPKLNRYLQENWTQFTKITNPLRSNCVRSKQKLIKCARDALMTCQDLQTLKNHYDVEKEKATIMENKVLNCDAHILKMKRKLEDYEMSLKRLKRELSEKEIVINRNKMEKVKAKEDFTQKMVHAQEKLNRDLERKLRSQKSALMYEMRNKENKLKAVKRIIASEEALDSRELETPRTILPESRSAESLSTAVSNERCQPVVTNIPSTPSVCTPSSVAVATSSTRPHVIARKMGVAVVNRRHRRSKSAGNDIWLDHRPPPQVPFGTLMQPTMAKKKSITKLTDAKDVTEVASKYCLLTQGQDSDGDLETRLYKGDVIPTAGGGAQVMFNDVEVLRQMSPTHSPIRTPGEIRQKIEEACAASADRFRHAKQ